MKLKRNIFVTFGMCCLLSGLCIVKTNAEIKKDFYIKNKNNINIYSLEEHISMINGICNKNELEEDNAILSKKNERADIEAKEYDLVMLKEKEIEENKRNEFNHFYIYTEDNINIYDNNFVIINQTTFNDKFEVIYYDEEKNPDYYEILYNNTSAYINKNSCSTNSLQNNRWNITLSNEDIELIAKIVYIEARGEPLSGQEGVVEVILNRITSNEFPNTVYDVVSAHNQFESFELLDKAFPNETQYAAINNVLYQNHNNVNDSIYFATSPLTNNLIIQIQNHYFCK